MLSFKLSIGKTAIAGSDLYTNEAIAGITPFTKDIIIDKFIFHLFNAKLIDLENVGFNTFGKSLNSTYLKNDIKIPLPPKKVQEQIVKDCEVIDAEFEKATKIIEHTTNEIEEKIDNIYQSDYRFQDISSVVYNIQYGINEKLNTDKRGYKVFRMNEIISKRMFDNGKMKYANISEEEFIKYKLTKGDILFNRTNSIVHVGKTGHFSLEGDYCFASYLIRIQVNKSFALSYFVNLMMNSKSFQNEAKSVATKAINQANINATKMKNIQIPVPPLKFQKQFVSEIEILEQRIAESQKVIDSVPERKKETIKKYL